MSGARTPAASIPRLADRSALPPSFSQQRLWLLDRLEPGLSADNRPIAFRIEGPLDRGALEIALRTVIERHEVLRYRFPGAEPDASAELIGAGNMPGLAVEDLTGIDPASRRDEARNRLGAEVARPFDLARGPLARARLLRLAAGEHWLVSTQHHIVSDGWSDAVFWRETTAAYDALRLGRSPRLPELPLQFADFAAWQRTQLSEQVLRAEIEFWRAHLEGVPSLLELPFDRPRSARPAGHAGAERRLRLSRAAIHDIQRLGRGSGATPFMTVLAGFSGLLSRYSGEGCVVVAVPVAGRPRRELERLVGPFTNQLAVKLDLADDPSFEEMLGRVKSSVLDALSRPEIPLGRLVEARQARFATDKAPAFQVALNWRSFDPPAFSPAGLQTTRLEVPRHSSRLDLTLEGRPTDDGAELLAEYSSALFDAATIDRLLGHLARLLADAAATPRTRVSELRLLSDEERRQVVSGFHGPVAEHRGAPRLEELFAEQARLTPKAVAARSAGRAVTYGQLLDWSHGIAASLAARGIGPGSRVGLYLAHSLEMLADMLGVLRAGAAFVALDPAHPEERLRFVAADAGLSAILADASWPYRALEPVPRLLQEDLKERSLQPLEVVRRDAQDAAYLFYTSGSTGQPKGVVASHPAAVNFLRGATALLGFSARDVFAATTTLSFDPAILELLLPLTLGARVEILDPGLLRDGEALSRVLRQRGVSVFQSSPAAFQVLLESGWTGAPELKLLCGGEPLTPSLADRLVRYGRELWNMYGPTETTVYCTGDRYTGGHVSVGRPIENVRAYVLDPHGEPVPVGVWGELHIGGCGLAIGYHDRPELTAERFVPDNFSPSPGARRYRTGDRGRFQPDGRIELRGRLDDQVKVRGVRIEPGEVEGALQRMPQVAHAAVIAEGGGPDVRLVAYLVPRQGGPPEPAQLRRDLARLLPDYMVPGRFVTLEALPLTPSGKVDRQRLPRTPPQPERPEHVAPRTELETTLASFFEEALEVPSLGVNDDFFDLGGHSLLAVRLFNRIRARLGVDLPLGAIIEAPTVATLAALLRGQGARRRQPTLVRLKPGSGAPVFFIHGFGGGVLIYRSLAQALAPETAAYALQEPRRGGPPRPLAEIAAEYVGEIRSVQAHGPYRLAGISFGGLVAFEMARQLAAAGEEVPFLALFDTRGPGYPSFPWAGPRALAHLRNLRHLSWSARAAYLRVRLAALPVFARRAATRRLRRLAKALGRPVPSGIQAAEGVLLSAAREYLEQVSARYPGRVLLFRAREQPVGCRHDPTNGWRSLAARLEAHEVPGGHESLLREPHVHAWSALFRERLEASPQCLSPSAPRPPAG